VEEQRLWVGASFPRRAEFGHSFSMAALAVEEFLDLVQQLPAASNRAVSVGNEVL
jgi:hypothetical protein